MTRQTALVTTMSAIGAAIIAASVTFAASAQGVPPAFTARCASCHSLEQVTAKMAARPADTRSEFLTGFLVRHGSTPAEERPAIITYVLANTR